MNLSDSAKNGFYRATAAGGVSGWISESAVTITSRKASPSAVTSRTESRNEPRTSTDARYFAGPVLGLAIFGGGSGITFGGRFGYKNAPDQAIGGFLSYTSLGQASLLVVAFEGHYFLPDNMAKNFFVNGKLGLGIVSVSIPNPLAGIPGSPTVAPTSTSSTALLLGIGGGYDYYLSPQFSVGGEANLILLTSGGNATDLTLVAAGKYYF